MNEWGEVAGATLRTRPRPGPWEQVLPRRAGTLGGCALGSSVNEGKRGRRGHPGATALVGACGQPSV